MTFSSLQSVGRQSPVQISPYLTEIAHKKVESFALTCFEMIVHWFLTTFSCFYPAYGDFYNSELERRAEIGSNTLSAAALQNLIKHGHT